MISYLNKYLADLYSSHRNQNHDFHNLRITYVFILILLSSESHSRPLASEGLDRNNSKTYKNEA
jgi:hypothetical protein